MKLYAATVRLGNGLDDGEAEPGATGRDVARGPRESLEDQSLVRVLDAGPLVAHPEAGRAGFQLTADGDSLTGLRVADGIVREVHDGLREALRVAADDADAGALERPVAVAEQPGLREGLVGQEVEIEGLRAQEVRARGPHQKQQVIHEAVHPVQF